MEIRLIENEKKRFLDLLLLADEQEYMIDRYLDRGDLFALYDGELRSVCVVTRESDTECELKSIATLEAFHKNGYGTELLDHIFSYYRGKFQTMLVGTGDSPWILRFYEKNGFVISHRVKNFFIDHYDHPMFDNGVQLVDMVYLKKEL